MKHYLIHYVDGNNLDLYWRCEADNYTHAIEQLKDHESTISGKVKFHELLNR